jgi:hypothetical protein
MYREKSKQLEFMKAWRRKQYQWVLDYKESHPCKDCGRFYPHYVMDFDHLGNKVMNVSRMIGYKRERIEQEIAKCDLVCSNCHRIRTHTPVA